MSGDALAGAAARKLGGRSSRRQFFKFLSAGSLGAGLFLTRTDVSLGAVSGCVGCGGGPVRRDRPDLHGCRLPVQDLPGRRRLRPSVPDVRRVVLLPDLGPARVPDSLFGVQLPARLPEPQLPLLRPARAPVPAHEGLGQHAVSLPAARSPDRSGSNGRLSDEVLGTNPRSPPSYSSCMKP